MCLVLTLQQLCAENVFICAENVFILSMTLNVLWSNVSTLAYLEIAVPFKNTA